MDKIKEALSRAQAAINEAMAACGGEDEHEKMEGESSELGDGSESDPMANKETKKAAVSAMLQKKYS